MLALISIGMIDEESDVHNQTHIVTDVCIQLLGKFFFNSVVVNQVYLNIKNHSELKDSSVSLLKKCITIRCMYCSQFECETQL